MEQSKLEIGKVACAFKKHVVYHTVKEKIDISSIDLIHFSVVCFLNCGAYFSAHYCFYFLDTSPRW